MWRQGDVFIDSVNRIPAGAKRVGHGVLIEGEATGHSHRLESLDVAEVFRNGDELFVRVFTESTRIVHEEHGAITLPRGVYRVWQQREYTPQAPGQSRWVAD
jgi:hypothetical protein